MLKNNIRYCAVDTGKKDTKLKSFDPDTKKTMLLKFCTKISEGTFDDDMFEKGTFIVQVDDGPVYKIGHGARNEPEMETSKKSEIHRVCTYAAVALACGCSEHMNVNIAIGIPFKLCEIPEERISYKKYILGEPGVLHKVRIKTTCSGPVHTSNFTFNKTNVYPEGIGTLYEFPARLQGITGIIDIGNLNTNYLYCDSFLINSDGCHTNEMGGKILITGLSGMLSGELGARVDVPLAAATLLKPYQERYLPANNGNKELSIRSKALIDQFLLEHVRSIKQACDAKHWPLLFMNLVFVGGTSRLLQNEIREVFGENVFIPDAPEYVNVNGFLRKLCADDGIDLEAETKKAAMDKTKAKANTGDKTA